MSRRSAPARFGLTELSTQQADALHRAVRLEIATFLFMVSAVVVVALTMGSSQAMKAAWVEDMLALVPPIAFLVAVRRAAKEPTTDHPYGFHRSVAVGHLVSAVSLLAFGLFLIEDSASGLIKLEHPPVGTVQLFGQTFWAGWLMIAAMVYTGIGPFVLARMKLPLSEQLHDKVLYADADMQKADWMTAAGTIVGVLCIGVGWWWGDSVAALFISASIVRDGWKNLNFAIGALMDQRARTYDDREPHPLNDRIQQTLCGLGWVVDARCRVRDMGHVFHVEAFVQGRHEDVTLEQVEQAVSALRSLDWKINDVVVMPVRSLPEDIPAE